MTIVVVRPIPRRHGEEGKDTETATAKDIVLQVTIVAAEATAIARDGVANRTMAARISSELLEYYHLEGLEDVRVIRDRQTSRFSLKASLSTRQSASLTKGQEISRQIGFLRFSSVDESRAFLEENYPYIRLYGRKSDRGDRAAKVRIAYSREREDRRSRAEGEWTCKMVGHVKSYKSSRLSSLISGSVPSRTMQPVNGVFAVSRCEQVCIPLAREPPANRQAETEVDPAPPVGVDIPRVANNGDNDVAPEGSPSQFLLFRGLEPSVTEELLAKGVAKLYKPNTGGQGQANNQKKGAKVASTTGDSNLGAREGSIRRVLLVRDRKSNESWRYGFAEFATVDDAQAALTRHNSFEKFTISSRPVLASYIHAGVFVPVISPTPSTARFTFSPLNKPSMKLTYWDEDAYVTELAVATDYNRGKSKTEQSESQAKASKDADKIKKRKADIATSAGVKKVAVPSHLQFWSDRHAELHGIQRKEAEDQNVGENISNPESKGASPGDVAGPPNQSYADVNRHCCYLCMRQFKTAAEVNKHERLSQLHRDNLQNEELKSRAMAKLAKNRDQHPTTEYRDRARERRQAFGSSKQSAKAKVPTQPKEEEEAPVQASSKGAELLSKMGWSAGSGLGAKGTGVTAPIATEVYAQGVGLGAQGGKLGDASEEAGRHTRNRYDEFLERTKETARERYERMS
ncbi:hypothetical protein Egran_02633 [Elaphomyces granulatus]|uniref:G-patch domain-containing protein n=1 Tax=Elaphomyces granulatus TaxID=519963 RepID=A0A232LZV0_9EURO|nr:hypothetical protein Egran_02633 [Elaphomyces granulatus]